MSKSATSASAVKVAVPQIDNEIVGTLIQMLKLKNHRICLHSFQVANYAVSIAAQMRLPKECLQHSWIYVLGRKWFHACFIHTHKKQIK